MLYKIEDIAKAFTQAVPIPTILFKVVTIIKEKKTALLKLGQEIAKDPVISAKLLSTVNSPFYSVKQKVSDIPHAISLLGFKEVSSIVFRLVSQTMSQGDKTSNKSQLYSAQKNWLHTVKTAHLARLLARQNRLPLLLESYLAGLMHDIGKSAIGVCIKREDEIKIIKEMFAKKEQAEAETIVLGFNHAKCGFHILKNMKLSVDILQAVARHHDDMEKDFTDMGFILALANVLSYYDDTDDYRELDGALERRFKITTADIRNLDNLYQELKIEMDAL